MAKDETSKTSRQGQQVQRIPAVVSLHRYFIWANKMRTDFDELLSRNRAKPLRTSDPWGARHIESNLYMSYWYAGLYVVIEGWQNLKTGGTVIEKLLKKGEYVLLLKRYRNGVFHFQRDYFDKRFVGVWQQKAGFVRWVRTLNREFGRFFLEWHRSYEQMKSNKETKHRKEVWDKN